jgi:starch phosphorylase
MVQEYTTRYYMPTYELVKKMATPDMSTGLEYAHWRNNLEKVWPLIKVHDVDLTQSHVKVGTAIDVTAVVDLGELGPDDVCVQLYYGALDTHGNIRDQDSDHIDMEFCGQNEDGLHIFCATINYTSSGDRGVSVRVLPRHQLLATSIQPGLITWA